MPAQPSPSSQEKANLHPRNPHRFQYDFQQLTRSCPELLPFVSETGFQAQSVDFKDPMAVKMLNKALLKHFYKIQLWDIPEGYLCPPIPGRADYIHYAADLLAVSNAAIVPEGKIIKVLDIGVGANSIYPLIGQHEYGWSFIGSEIDHIAIRSANNIITANKLSKIIEIRKQSIGNNIFNQIIKPGEFFDLTICNPPFHSSPSEANKGTRRKWTNLGQKAEKDSLNFGGQNSELWCEGGEEQFLGKMIEESAQFSKTCLWFTSLVSKQTTLPAVYRLLKKMKAIEVKTIDMSQGQKVSRVVAWTFLNKYEQGEWVQHWNK